MTNRDEESPAQSPASGIEPASYLLFKNGVQVGPLTYTLLRSMLDGGLILPDDLVWCEGMPEWKPASDVLIPKPVPRSGPPPLPAGFLEAAKQRQAEASRSPASATPAPAPASVPDAAEPLEWRTIRDGIRYFESGQTDYYEVPSSEGPAGVGLRITFPSDWRARLLPTQPPVVLLHKMGSLKFSVFFKPSCQKEKFNEADADRLLSKTALAQCLQRNGEKSDIDVHLKIKIHDSVAAIVHFAGIVKTEEGLTQVLQISAYFIKNSSLFEIAALLSWPHDPAIDSQQILPDMLRFHQIILERLTFLKEGDVTTSARPSEDLAGHRATDAAQDIAPSYQDENTEAIHSAAESADHPLLIAAGDVLTYNVEFVDVGDYPKASGLAFSLCHPREWVAQEVDQDSYIQVFRHPEVEPDLSLQICSAPSDSHTDSELRQVLARALLSEFLKDNHGMEVTSYEPGLVAGHAAAFADTLVEAKTPNSEPVFYLSYSVFFVSQGLLVRLGLDIAGREHELSELSQQRELGRDLVKAVAKTICSTNRMPQKEREENKTAQQVFVDNALKSLVEMHPSRMNPPPSEEPDAAIDILSQSPEERTQMAISDMQQGRMIEFESPGPLRGPGMGLSLKYPACWRALSLPVSNRLEIFMDDGFIALGTMTLFEETRDLPMNNSQLEEVMTHAGMRTFLKHRRIVNITDAVVAGAPALLVEVIRKEEDSHGETFYQMDRSLYFRHQDILLSLRLTTVSLGDDPDAPDARADMDQIAPLQDLIAQTVVLHPRYVPQTPVQRSVMDMLCGRTAFQEQVVTAGELKGFTLGVTYPQGWLPETREKEASESICLDLTLREASASLHVAAQSIVELTSQSSRKQFISRSTVEEMLMDGYRGIELTTHPQITHFKHHVVAGVQIAIVESSMLIENDQKRQIVLFRHQIIWLESVMLLVNLMVIGDESTEEETLITRVEATPLMEMMADQLKISSALQECSPTLMAWLEMGQGSTEVFDSIAHPKANGMRLVMKYPSSWLALDGPGGRVMQSFEMRDDPSFAITLAVWPVGGPALTTAQKKEKLSRWELTQFLSQALGMKVTEHLRVGIAGQHAARVEMKFEGQQEDGTASLHLVSSYFFYHQNNLVGLSLTIYGSPQFESRMRGFRFHSSALLDTMAKSIELWE